MDQSAEHWHRCGFILLGATIYLSMPANDADFRLHAKTSFFAFRVAGDRTITLESSDWTAWGTPVDSADGGTERFSRSPGDVPPGSPPDRIDISLQAGDVVQIRADDVTPFRYNILLPTRAATLSVQSGSGASLYTRQDDGKRLAIANSAPTFQFHAGQGPEEMRFTLAECQVVLNRPSTPDRADSASIPLPLASCGRDIAKRLRVDRIGLKKARKTEMASRPVYSTAESSFWIFQTVKSRCITERICASMSTMSK
ncbi:hypothetical protein [Caballeronia sp. LZ001]|uniref:hypothetical protein n=1 Tax=Caballeronia sp. LZ001 TaxID=3038553 RepID=UPI0028633447|nr:hypothetical protein [Caballeronia sp. LZ001]MDR5806339.1 hypothetical protein [Caballeronia sp. LZ001]